MIRTCVDCGSPVSSQSKGRCKPCSARHLNTCPEIIANRAAARAAYHARPEVKQANAARLAKHAANLSDAERERRRERGRHIAATVLHTPENKAKAADPAVRAKAGRKRTDTVLAWCPPEYRDRYRHLKDSQLLRAAEARRIIEDEIATDERRRLAAMTPHERQLERIRNGARIVEVQPLRRADPAITLGGVAPEAM